MAGDWIKWTKGLPDKPEVVRLAGLLRLSREVVVCRLMRFWEWCDDNIPKDAIREVGGSAFVTLSPHDGDNVAFIDALVGTPLFADSLAAVGWLRLRDGRLELPNFGRHNGETAKTRARNANNQKRMRLVQEPSQGPSITTKTTKRVTKMSPKMSPHDGDKTVTREEERREEIDTERQTPKPPFEPADTPKQTESGSSEKPPVSFVRAAPNFSDLDAVGHSDGSKTKAPQNAIKTKSHEVVFPDALNTRTFIEVWTEWVADRRERRKPITDRAAKTQLAALAKVGEVKAIETIRRSIANGWTGLFPEAVGNNGAARGAGRTKAEQLDDYFADQVESVLESQIEERSRQHE